MIVPIYWGPLVAFILISFFIKMDEYFKEKEKKNLEKKMKTTIISITNQSAFLKENKPWKKSNICNTNEKETNLYAYNELCNFFKDNLKKDKDKIDIIINIETSYITDEEALSIFNILKYRNEIIRVHIIKTSPFFGYLLVLLADNLSIENIQNTINSSSNDELTKRDLEAYLIAKQTRQPEKYKYFINKTETMTTFEKLRDNGFHIETQLSSYIKKII
jgi:hypothetical protein